MDLNEQGWNSIGEFNRSYNDIGRLGKTKMNVTTEPTIILSSNELSDFVKVYTRLKEKEYIFADYFAEVSGIPVEKVKHYLDKLVELEQARKTVIPPGFYKKQDGSPITEMYFPV